MSKLLEDAKRAGLTDGDLDALKDVNSLSGESTAEPAAEVEAAAVDPNAKAEPVAQAEPVAEAAAEESDKEEPGQEDEPVRPAAFAPQLKAPELTADANERLTAIEAERDAQLQKMYDGDQSKAECMAALTKLDREAQDIRDQKTQAKIAAQFNEQMNDQLLSHTRSMFMRGAAKRDGVDYSKPEIQAKLDRAFALLAQDPEHSQKPMSELESVYEAAHAMVKLQMGIAPGAKPKLELVKPAIPGKTALEANPPPVTLGQMPAAAPAQVQDEALAKFANLQGDDLERHMASLPKGEISRLLRASS